MPIGERLVRQVPQLGRLDVEVLAAVGDVPRRANSARMISTASSSISCRTSTDGQPLADDVLVEVLAGAEPEA